MVDELLEAVFLKRYRAFKMHEADAVKSVKGYLSRKGLGLRPATLEICKRAIVYISNKSCMASYAYSASHTVPLQLMDIYNYPTSGLGTILYHYVKRLSDEGNLWSKNQVLNERDACKNSHQLFGSTDGVKERYPLGSTKAQDRPQDLCGPSVQCMNALSKFCTEGPDLDTTLCEEEVAWLLAGSSRVSNSIIFVSDSIFANFKNIQAHAELSILWNQERDKDAALELNAPSFTISQNDELEFCYAHPGHLHKFSDKGKIPELPVFNQWNDCRASMKGDVTLLAFHQLLNNLTETLAGNSWPLSVVELAQVLSFPYLPCSERAPHPLDSFFEECLPCKVDNYHKIRNLPCITGFHPNEFATTGRCFHLTQFIKDKHEVAMRVMKYAMQAPSLEQSLEEFEYDFRYLPSFANLSMALPFGARQDFEYGRKPTKTFNPRVFGCSLGSSVLAQELLRPSDCRLFTRTYSNFGLA